VNPWRGWAFPCRQWCRVQCLCSNPIFKNP
jgi:hypothetical protein